MAMRLGSVSELRSGAGTAETCGVLFLPLLQSPPGSPPLCLASLHQKRWREERPGYGGALGKPWLWPHVPPFPEALSDHDRMMYTWQVLVMITCARRLTLRDSHPEHQQGLCSQLLIGQL